MGVPTVDPGRAALDGYELKMMISSALAWLRFHQESVNALNVFPVPDGDTGTNMTLTMNSAWEEIAEVHDTHAGTIAGKLAHGALMGARGNSGVILSQIWRGFAHSIDGKPQITPQDFARAMRGAAETAYKGVVKPVEGTILTVIREVADEAVRAAPQARDIVNLLEILVERAKLSVAHTPQLLPVLRQAGVVDSGGQGLLVIFDGMLRYLQGLPTVMQASQTAAGLQTGVSAIEFDENYPYDVQFIIMGHQMDIDAIRAKIESMGDCPMTVGDSETIKVHVHVADPGIPISYGSLCGSLRDVVVEDMQAQYHQFEAAHRSGSALGPGLVAPVALLQEEVQNICVVVVSTGEGLAEIFRSLGATAIVPGGQTMNPSTAEILDAVDQCHAEHVIILPNNKNIIMAAESAAEVAAKNTIVVPTRTIPQGIAALLTLDQNSTLDHNALTMAQAASEVITGEVTWATRDVELNGVSVKEGDAIGLLDGQLVVDAQSYEEVVRWLLAEAELDDRELVTLYYGKDIDSAQAEGLVGALGENYPDLEFEIFAGGQPNYPYIISIE